jgi:putative flippase GtrA
MAGQLNRKLVRYVLAGGISFLFEYAVFIFVVYEIGLKPEAGQAISYILTLIVNFIILRRWTFKLKGGTEIRRHLVKYCLLVVFNLPATTLLIGWLTAIGLVAFIAKIAVVALTAVWNYIVYDKLIFKEQPSPEDVI